MSSAAEKAAARRRKVLERAKKGNSVTASMDDEVGLAAEAAVAAATAAGAPIEESPEVETDSAVVSTPTKDDTSDSVIEEASPATSVTSSISEKEQSLRKERPLEARRRMLQERKARAAQKAQEEAAKNIDDMDLPIEESNDLPDWARESKGEEDGSEATNNTNTAEAEGSPKVQFISKTAREVEIEIANMTRVADGSFLGAEEDEKVEKDSDIYTYSEPVDVDPSEVTESPSKGIRTLREKMMLKKAQRRASENSPKASDKSSTSSDGDDASTKVKAKKLQEIVDAKAADPSTVPRLIRILVLMTLAIFAGINSYSNNHVDVNKVLQRRNNILRDNSVSALSSTSIKSKLKKAKNSKSQNVDSEINRLVDNNDVNLDDLFDQEASEDLGLSVQPAAPTTGLFGYVSNTYSWLEDRASNIHNSLESHEAIGNTYKQVCKHLTQSEEEKAISNTIVESVYRTTFHRPDVGKTLGAEYMLGDSSSTEGCSRSWKDAAIVAVFISWVLGTFTTNALKASRFAPKSLNVPNSPTEKTGILGMVWNWFTGDFDVLDYVHELIFGIVGEFALFYMTAIMTCTVLIYLNTSLPESGN